jgi:predicted phage-related endonuclease
MVNVNSPLHWGQKFEPLSVLIYERDYNTKVEDFGCIQHPKYNFIGASPDGIVTDKKSQKFGKMLEIKNVVSREITGIPKKEYWVQMQLQMEVCDLDECDFLETKFIEYPDTVAFYNYTFLF